MANVAPRTGAWIETWIFTRTGFGPLSRLVQARGLKLFGVMTTDVQGESRLVQARGLKLTIQILILDQWVAPRTGAWIETIKPKE